MSFSIYFVGNAEDVSGGIKSQKEKGVENIESDGIVLNEIIATYDGQEILKKPFLEFIHLKTGEEEKIFQSREELEDYVFLYAVYDHFNQEMLKSDVSSNPEIQEELSILEKYSLAYFYQKQHNSITLMEELGSFIENYEVGQLSDITLSYIIKKEDVGASLNEVKQDAELYENLLYGYKEVLFYERKAKEQSLDKSQTYLTFHDYQVKEYFANLYVENYLSSLNADNDVLDENFKEWLTDQKFEEYKVSHIYFKDLLTAEKVLHLLKEGEITFLDAVLHYSEDELSKQYEGKVGHGDWVTFPDQRHPFAQALVEQEIGEMSNKVIQGIDGFHIIFLESKRKAEMPDYMNRPDFKYYLWTSKKIDDLYKNIRDVMDINII